jgi:uncharacterized membrane protein
MTGFDILDRYDIVAILVMGVLMIAVLALGAPLWTAMAIVLAGNIGIFIRHFDELVRR